MTSRIAVVADADRTKWDSKYAKREGPGQPSSFLLGLDASLPRTGSALDVAGGAGRHALWLAERGLDVVLLDVSEVGLSLARAAAAARGLSLTTRALDLESEPLPPGPWDLICSFHYLQRELFAVFPTALAPGGLLVFCQPTRTNLHKHAHPSARYLLDDGELPSLVQGLQVLSYEEGWSDEGRHEARLVARRD